MPSGQARPRPGRFPLLGFSLLVGAGLALTVALLGLALVLDPEEDETDVAAGAAVLAGLLVGLLLWAGTSAARRSGWSRSSTAVLAGTTVVGTVVLTLLLAT